MENRIIYGITDCSESGVALLEDNPTTSSPEEIATINSNAYQRYLNITTGSQDDVIFIENNSAVNEPNNFEFVTRERLIEVKQKRFLSVQSIKKAMYMYYLEHLTKAAEKGMLLKI